MAQKTKLTVRVDESALDAAKQYAAAHDTSLSRLISEFLGQLRVQEREEARAPILRKLSGILPSNLSIESHRAHLARKYGV